MNYFLVIAFLAIVLIGFYFGYKKKNKEPEPAQYSVGTPIIKPEGLTEETDKLDVFTSTIASRKEAMEWWRNCTLGEKRVSMYDAQLGDRKIHTLTRLELDIIYQIHNELSLI